MVVTNSSQLRQSIQNRINSQDRYAGISNPDVKAQIQAYETLRNKQSQAKRNLAPSAQAHLDSVNRAVTNQNRINRQRHVRDIASKQQGMGGVIRGGTPNSDIYLSPGAARRVAEVTIKPMIMKQLAVPAKGARLTPSQMSANLDAYAEYGGNVRHNINVMAANKGITIQEGGLLDNFKGSYDFNRELIKLRKDMSSSERERILYHELGHALESTMPYFKENLKNNRRMYGSPSVDNKDVIIVRSPASELFADTFSDFARSPYHFAKRNEVNMRTAKAFEKSLNDFNKSFKRNQVEFFNKKTKGLFK